jgi:ethanolamine utilization protein EutQ (cupin superfamily)
MASVSTEPTDKNVQTRIRESVIARMGTQVDPELLDVIIQRVLKSTGVK